MFFSQVIILNIFLKNATINSHNNFCDNQMSEDKPTPLLAIKNLPF